MRSSGRPYVSLLFWLVGLVFLAVVVKGFRHEAGDGREQHCNRIARTEAAIEGTDREEAKRQCMAAAAGHAVFFTPESLSDAVRRGRNLSDRRGAGA